MAKSSPYSSAATAAAAAADAPVTNAAEDTMFSSLTQYGIDERLLKSVTQARGLSVMTPVQAQTLPITLDRIDVLAQAKTGTGKTLAFLLPAIQRLLTTRPIQPGVPRAGAGAAPRTPSLLVISPTRELANQIAKEAEELLQGMYLGTKIPSKYKVQVAIGGTNANQGVKNLSKGCDILVATPGRMNDYLQDPNIKLLMQGVQTVVLDEADRLLDMGFIKDVRQIVQALGPKESQQRQGMLFSATMDRKIHDVADFVLSANYKTVNCIPEGEAKTHERVSQRSIVVEEFADLVPAASGALAKDRAAQGTKPFKAIVFVPTTVHADLFAGFLNGMAWDAKFPTVNSIHSRLSQGRRTRLAEEFKNSSSGILVATDVIARGLHFPGVTHIYQAGLPDDKASYIHRLGRTARAGAEGEGTLLLTRAEAVFANKELSEVDFIDTPASLTTKSPRVKEVMLKVDEEVRQKVYRSLMGYYKGKLSVLGWKANMLVAKMNEFALKGLYLPEIPSFEAKTIGKMGLKGVEGIRIAPRG